MLAILLRNSPAKLPELNTFDNFSVKFSDRIRNCEDALLVEEQGLAILSCDPGRDLWNTVMGTFVENRSMIPSGELLLYHYGRWDDTEDALQPVKLINQPTDYSFHPLGIDYHAPSSTLFVCNHHLHGSRIDVFTLDLSGGQPVATYTTTIISPLIRSPNSIAVLNEHELYVSNDHYVLAKDHPWLSRIEAFGGIPGGSLVYVSLDAREPQVQKVASIPFANGITLMNDSSIAVASTSTARVLTYNILDDRSLQAAGEIKVQFAPDNLSTDKNGVLYIAGHPHPPSLDSMRELRLSCVIATGLGDDSCRKRGAPSWVAKWTQREGLTDLYISKDEFGSSSTAMFDASRRFGLMTGLYEEGILVWKQKK